MKNIIKLFVIVFVGILLCGCSPADRDKVIKYLNEKEVFKDKNNSYVLDKKSIIMDKTSPKHKKYYSYAWKVNAKINNNDVEFYVLDLPYYHEWVSYDLEDTLNNSLTPIALNNVKMNNFKLKKVDNSYLKKRYPTAPQKIIDDLNDNVLITYISSYNEINDRYNELQEIYNDASNLNWKNIEYKYNIYLDYNLNDELINDYRSFYSFNSLEQLNEKIGYFKRNILEDIIMLQIDKYLNDIDNETISNMINSYTYRIGIKNDNVENGFDLIDDLIAYNGKISYGTLFKLLKKYNKNVFGTSDNFVFVKENNEIYNFSYGYYDNVKDEEYKDGTRPVYYFLLNGKKTQIKDNYNYKPYLSFEEVKNITGLDVIKLIYSEERGIRIDI